MEDVCKKIPFRERDVERGCQGMEIRRDKNQILLLLVTRHDGMVDEMMDHIC